MVTLMSFKIEESKEVFGLFCRSWKSSFQPPVFCDHLTKMNTTLLNLKRMTRMRNRTVN